MIYQFTDVDGAPVRGRSSEAMRLNGVYLEDLIDGYQTLYAVGRESLSPSLDTFEVGSRDGSVLRSKRFPARTITVGYQLVSASPEAFREAFNTLGKVLNVENATLIFEDEKDKYFVGTPSGVSDVPKGRSSFVSEFTILCLDPMKHALETTSQKPQSDDTIDFEYDGSYPATPFLTVTAKSDLGYVGLFDASGHVLQIGDPEEMDGATYEHSENLIPKGNFRTDGVSGWTTGVAQLVTACGTRAQSGTVKTDAVNGLQGDSFGTGSSWHGASVTKTLPADSNGETGASTFTFEWNSEFYTKNVADGGETQFIVSGVTASGAKHNIAAVHYCKNSGLSGFIDVYAYDKRIKTLNIPNLGANGALSGKTAGRGSISKSGSTFTFNLNGTTFSVDMQEAKEAKATAVSIYFEAYGTKPHISEQKVYSVSLMKHHVESLQDVPNKFRSGDVITADFATGEIRKNGVLDASLGALGNSWDTFRIVPGTNQIATAYSGWATKPDITLSYRKAFL